MDKKKKESEPVVEKKASAVEIVVTVLEGDVLKRGKERLVAISTVMSAAKDAGAYSKLNGILFRNRDDVVEAFGYRWLDSARKEPYSWRNVRLAFNVVAS